MTDYIGRHPELADEIRSLFPALVLMERYKPESGDLTGAFESGAPTGRIAPRRLGDYRILREVGRGGMGVVYEAEQESLGRHVALKVPPASLLLDPRLIARFHREARSAARLHHTNIVPVFGVGEHEGLHYYVMQFIRGQGLDQVIRELRRLREHTGGGASNGEAGAGAEDDGTRTKATDLARALLTGRFDRGAAESSGSEPAPGAASTIAARIGPARGPETPARDGPRPDRGGPPAPRSGQGQSLSHSGSGRRYFDDVARIGVQVARALDYAHAQGILHRDIKPSNLLMDLQGTVWLTDFGLAKSSDGEDLTQTGDIVGTLRYMPPERFAGTSEPRSDIYSLGLTLYELLTLRPAFEATDRDRLIRELTQEVPPRLRRLEPEIPRDLDTIIFKAIEREPARRYATAGDLAEDLERFLDDRPILARPVSSVEHAWRWGRRNRAVASLISAVGLLLAAGTLGSTFAAASFRDAAANEKKARGEADQAKGEAIEAKREADARAEENRSRLVGQYVRDGSRRLEDGDPLGALPWFVEALRLDAGDPSREEPHRLRLATVFYQCPRLARFALAEGYVHDVYVSSGGRRALSSHREGFARLWDVAGAATIGPRLDVGGACKAYFNGDGSRVVTITLAGRARLWDGDTGRPLGEPWDLVAPGNAALSPDGSRLLSFAPGEPRKPSEPPALRLWDTSIGRLVGEPWTIAPPRQGWGLAFSANGRLALAFLGGVGVEIRDAETGRTFPCPLAEERSSTQSVLSPDRRSVLIIGKSGKTLRLFDADTGQAASPPIEVDGPFAPYVSFRGGRLATVKSEGSTQTVQVREIPSGKPAGPGLVRPGGQVRVFLSPDDARIMTIEKDGIWVWDVATARPVGFPIRLGASVNAAFSPDGGMIFTSDGLNARVFDAATGLPAGPPLRHSAQIQPKVPAFTPDGKRILTVCYDQTIWLRETMPPGLPLIALPLDGAANSVDISPDGLRVVTASEGGTARVWDAATGLPAGAPLAHRNPVDFAAFGHANRRVLTHSLKKTGTAERYETSEEELRLWDVESGTLLGTAETPNGCVAHDVSPDGDAVLFASHDGLVHLWKPGGRPSALADEGVPMTQIAAVSFRDGGRRAIARTNSGKVRLWDVASGAPLGPARGPFGTSTMLSPDARLAASGGQEGKARIWDTETGETVGPQIVQGSPVVRPLGFSPDGRRLLTATQEPRLYVWDVATGRQAFAPLTIDGAIASAEFSADGRRILCSAGGLAQLWDAETGQPLTPPLRDARLGGVKLGGDGRSVVAADGSEKVARAWLWRLLPDARPAAELARVSTLLTGRRLDPLLGLMSADAEDVKKAWDAEH